MLRKLVGYAAYMLGANVFTAFFSFGVSALGMATRSKEAFGSYGVYLLVLGVGNLLCVSGANAAIQRFAADSDENRARFAKVAYLLFLGLAVIAGALSAASGPLLGPSVALGVIAVPFSVVYWWARYLVRSNLDARREARLMVADSISHTVLQLGFITLTAFDDALVYGDFVGRLLTGLFALATLPRALGMRHREVFGAEVPRAFVVESLRFALPVWGAGAVFLVKNKLQQTWTEVGLGRRVHGGYQGLVTMWQFVGKPMEYFGQAALPGLVRAREARHELHRDILRLALVVLPLVAIVAASGVPLVFTAIDAALSALGSTAASTAEKYSEVPMLMAISALAVPMSAVEMVTNGYSLAEGRPRAVLYAQSADVVTVVLTLYPLAKAYGVHGVILSGVIGEIVNAVAYLFVLRGTHRAAMRTTTVWGLTAFAWTAGSLAPTFYFTGRPWSWLLALPAALTYVAGMAISGLFGREDLRRAASAVALMRTAPGAARK